MKNLIFIAFIGAFAVMGCENTTEKKTESASTTASGTTPTVADTTQMSTPIITGGSTFTCYQYVDKSKDTYSCQIETRATLNPFVSGYYDNAPYQKDGAHGVLKDGVIKGDMFTADYVYMIEGNIQAEEVYFKMEGDKLTQLSGELVEQKGKLVAKDKTKLKAGIVMTKVDCSKLKGIIDGIKSYEKQLVLPK